MTKAMETCPNTTSWRFDVPGGPAKWLAVTGRPLPFASTTMAMADEVCRTPANRLYCRSPWISVSLFTRAPVNSDSIGAPRRLGTPRPARNCSHGNVLFACAVEGTVGLRWCSSDSMVMTLNTLGEETVTSMPGTTSRSPITIHLDLGLDHEESSRSRSQEAQEIKGPQAFSDFQRRGPLRIQGSSVGEWHQPRQVLITRPPGCVDGLSFGRRTEASHAS